MEIDSGVFHVSSISISQPDFFLIFIFDLSIQIHFVVVVVFASLFS